MKPKSDTTKQPEQTPPTSTEYVEPLGFKGTIGKWKYEAHEEWSKYWGNIVSDTDPENRIIRTIDCLLKYAPNKEMEANAKLISQSKELAKALQDAVAFAEKCYKADKDSADWYNNNTPGVGQKLDYQSYPPLPKWAEHAKQVLKQAGLTE